MGAPKISYEIELEEYETLCRHLYQASGIRLGDKKQSLVEARLLKRLHFLGLSNFGEYINYLESHLEVEFQFLIEAMTTHKTEWYRESLHFDFLAEKIAVQKKRPLHIWSAACSTGEELWTIALILKEQGFTPKDYRLLGTDISGVVVEQAERALYSQKGMQAPPYNEQTKDFFKMRRDLNPPQLEVHSQYRESTKFKKMNLIDLQLPQNLKFDFIFLRNVLIYFDVLSTQKVISSLVKHLKPESYLILGMSESLSGIDNQLKNCGHSIYQLI